MIDLRSWLPGLGPDEEDGQADPVQKTLDLLGQGARSASQAVSDVGTSIGQAATAATDAVSGLGQQLAASLPPSPFSSPPEPTSARPEPAQPSFAPEDYSFAPPDNPVARGLTNAGTAAVAAYDESARSPLWSAPALAPARAAYIAEKAMPEIGGEVGAAVGRAAGGPDAAPYFTVPESVPVVGGQEVGPEQVGRFVGEQLTDPLTYVGAAGAAAKGAPLRHIAAEAVRGLPGVGESEALLRGGAGLVRRGAGALSDALRPGEIPEGGVMELGSGFVPSRGRASGIDPEMQARAARETLDALSARLKDADDAVVAAERSNDPTALRVADRAYNAVRREYDAASDALERLRPSEAEQDAAIEAAGYGRPASEVGLADEGAAVPREGRVRGAVSPFEHVAPEGNTVNLNAGLDPFRAPLSNFAQGALVGAASEDLQAEAEGREADPTSRLVRAVGVGGLGVLAGNRAARQAAMQGARRLGSGFVPSAGMDPDEIADLARRAAETPMTGPHTDAQHVTRNVAQQIRKQADRGVVPELPEGPMAPPNAPPDWWDHIENWRYNMGILANIANMGVQLGGGAVSAGLGGVTEAVRLGLLRGQPEALPRIAGRALAAVPEGLRAMKRTALGDIPEAIEAGADARASLGARERAAGREGWGLAADVVGAPGRVVTQAPDAFWYEVMRQAGIEQAAADQARRELGSSPVQMGARARRQAELAAAPTPEMMAEAEALAKDATFKGEPGAILNSPKKLGAWVTGEVHPAAGRVMGQIGNFLMPIYNTIARIHERGLEYQPGLGLAPLEKAGLGPAGRARPMDRRLAQQLVGAGILAGGLQYAAAGKVRGPGPADPNEAQALRDQGYTPNTTNIAGFWVPNSWLGEAGILLNEVGAINDAMLYDDRGKAWSEAGGQQKVDRIIRQVGRAFADYPALDTIKTVQDLFTNPSQAFGSLLGEVAAQYSPGLIRSFAAQEDPLSRTRTRGDDVPIWQRALETAAQRSGIGRQSLPAAQDILGRDLANPRQGAAAWLPRVGTDRPDPIIQAYLDADLNIGDPPKDLTLKDAPPNTPRPELTADEQRRWNTLRGDALIRRTEAMVANPAFQAAPLQARQERLEKARAEAAEEAHARLRSEIGAQEINRRIGELRARRAS